MSSPVSLLRFCVLGVVLCVSGLAQQPAALNAAARSQIALLQAEKAGRSATQRKMDSRLVHLVKKQRGERLGAGLERFEQRVKPAADGRELVDIKASVNDALLAHLRAAGAEIVASVPRFDAVRARVPAAALEALAAREDVQFVRPAVRAMTNVGSQTSAGDKTHAADAARATFKATGRGVKVGVISDSVDFLSNVQGSGDLPAVTVLPGQDGLGNSGEGTAMLEIVHDLAPDAELFFATAFISEAQFAQNILDLRAAGCDVIVDDIIYFDESPFMDGPVAQAVDAVVADGALYFSSAGNEGNKNDNTSGTWEGDFVDGGAAGAPIGGSGRLHAFGVNNFNNVMVGGFAVTLFWADPYGASENDYDLYVLDSTGTTVLEASTNLQTGSQDPFEIVGPPLAGERLVVVKAADAQPRFLHMKNFRGRLSASTSGACVGHAAAAGAFAVAAVNAATSNPNPFAGGGTNPVETFSTDGLRRVFYHPDGTPITPGDFSATGGTVRQKPEIAAADGVATATPGFNPFFGTSAAAPHAAAIAALMWSYNRALTPAQIRAALTGTALDIEAAGVDRDSGVGIVMAPAAIQALSPGPIVSVLAASVTAESFTPANNAPDPGETVTVSVTLRNVGAVPGAITATLLAGGGVSAPGAPQDYGTLGPSGGQAARSFTFTANGPPGGTLNARFALASGATSLGTISVPFTFGSTSTPQTHLNTSAITINDDAAAAPYPSQISVSGVPGSVSKVTAQIRQLTHTYPPDVGLLLVSPSGRTVELMNGAGAGQPVTNVTLTFDDAAAAVVPAGMMTSGSYRPALYDPMRDAYAAPAPAEPYGAALSTFQGDSPNGTWSLYVIDSAVGDAGAINGGWTLTITPAAAATNGSGPDLNVVVSPAGPLDLGATTTLTVQVFNNGPAAANGVTLDTTLPEQLVPFGGNITQGGGSFNGQDVTINFGTIAAGGSATLTLDCDVVGLGTAALFFLSGLNETDNEPANNTGAADVFIGLPNLVAGSAVVSTVPGTGTDAAEFSSSDPIYLDFTMSNTGNAPAGVPFVAEVFVDGVLKRTVSRPLPLVQGASVQALDVELGPLPSGQHTVLVRIDGARDVTESTKADNEIARTFTVAGPNLAPGTIVVSKTAGTTVDTPIFQTSDAVFVDYSLTNAGGVVTGVATTAEVFLDGNLVTQFNVSDTLGSGQSAGEVDLALGSLAAGSHTIRVVLDAGGVLAETDETDNVFTKDFFVNSPPTIADIGNVVFDEDMPQAPIAFSIGDAETSADDLTVSATSSKPSFLFSLGGSGANRTITMLPMTNANGFGTITVTVRDGAGGMVTDSFMVTVNAVNDPPSFVKGSNVTVSEDAGAQTVAAWATGMSVGPNNESAQSLAFTVTNDNNALFSAQPAVSAAGTLTFTPAADANGSATVTVRAVDTGGGNDTSAPQTFTIAVLAVNDAPVFTAGADVTVDEDAGAVSVAWASAISPGPANESAQTVGFVVGNDAPMLFTLPPAINAAGTLTFTPAPNASGTSTVTVSARDSLGAESAPVTFTIAVNAVNDAPSFTLAGDLSVARDAGAQTVANFAGSISAGPADEAGQTVSFAVVSDEPGLFNVPPALAANGTLTFTPATTASGKTMVTVTATDSAGASSAAQTFEIAVTSFAEETGNYAGLAAPPAAAGSTAAQAGAFSVLVKDSGSLTGKVLLGGVRYRFKGFVQNDGRVRFGSVPNTPALELRRRGLPSLQLALRLDVAGGAGGLTGTVADGATAFSVLAAERAGYDRRTNPATPPLAGRYTVLLAHRTGVNNGAAQSEYAQGDGVGTLTISETGVAKLRGTLADGGKISAAAPLSAGNRWPFFAATDRRRGAIGGFVEFVPGSGTTDAAGNNLLWHKPANARSARYPDGWPGGVFVDLAGGTFAAVDGQSVLPGLGAADADGNAEFMAADGGLAAPLLKALSIDPRDRATVLVPATDRLRLSLNRRTGLLRGRFTMPDGKAVSFSGAVLQSQLRAGGFFLGRKESGGILLTPDDTPGLGN